MWHLVLVLLVELVASQPAGEYLITVEHKIGAGEWFQRATLVLPTIKQSSLPSHNIPQYIPITANEQVESLKSLEHGNQTLYFIRVPFKAVEENDIDDVTDYVSVVVRACTIVEADLTHSLTVHMDSTGYITGLSLHSPVEQCTGKVTTATTFNTKCTVSYPSVGASPDVHSFIQFKEKEEKKKSEQGNDKRSFLAKYWMYILPVALLLMMSMGGS